MTPPVAPRVEDLSCAGGRLRWSNPVPFDRVLLFKNGLELAELPGTAESFNDPDSNGEMTAYTVVSELDGFRSPESTCVDNGIWILEVGDVQVPADTTRVTVPIYITTAAMIFGVEMHLGIDMEHLELLRDESLAIAGTVTHADSESILIGIGRHGVPATGIVFDLFPPVQHEKNLPPGLRQHFYNFVFDVEPGAFSDGDTLDVSFVSAALDYPRATTQELDVLIDGQIRFGAAGPAAVNGLEADVVGDGGAGGEAVPGSSVALSWRNGGDYDTVRILRNNELLAEVSGGATEFVDPGAQRACIRTRSSG